MKKFWKALGLTALAAAVIPYRVKKDPESATTTVDALLWQATRRTGEAEKNLDVTVGFKSPFSAAREEATLFADDEPEAAVVTEAPAAPAQAEAPAEPAATEEDFDPEL